MKDLPGPTVQKPEGISTSFHLTTSQASSPQHLDLRVLPTSSPCFLRSPRESGGGISVFRCFRWFGGDRCPMRLVACFGGFQNRRKTGRPTTGEVETSRDHVFFLDKVGEASGQKVHHQNPRNQSSYHHYFGLWNVQGKSWGPVILSPLLVAMFDLHVDEKQV